MIRFFKTLFSGNKIVTEETDSMKKFLIVGLGNIGAAYAETRHNIGFKIVDALSKRLDFPFETQKLGDVGYAKIKGKTVVSLKPSTYMNLSGKALKYWMEKESIPLEHVLILTDDINLPFGTLRLKTKGSDGGHNGLKDIQNVVQSSNYNRLRFGVGANFATGKQVDYVLSEWSPEEQKIMQERLEKCTDLIHSFVIAGVTQTMNQFNGT
jgi:PTH1 family peptidyl-tRNA hydrolase